MRPSGKMSCTEARMSKRRYSGAFLGLLVATSVASAGCGGEVDPGVDDGSNPNAALDTGGKCGARFVPQEERDAIEAAMAQYASNLQFTPDAARTIPVHFHIITSGGQGDVS